MNMVSDTARQSGCGCAYSGAVATAITIVVATDTLLPRIRGRNCHDAPSRNGACGSTIATVGTAVTLYFVRFSVNSSVPAVHTVRLAACSPSLDGPSRGRDTTLRQGTSNRVDTWATLSLPRSAISQAGHGAMC